MASDGEWSAESVRCDGFRMLTDPLDNNIREVLKRDGVWEPDATKTVLERWKDGIVIDVGAHWGYYSLLLARQNKHVFALEPNPRMFRFLIHNIYLNRLEKDVTALQIGAWDSMVRLDANVVGANTGGTGVGLNPEGGYVVGARLDDLFDSADYIKIDCEGADMNMVRGAEHLIKTRHPQLLIESADNQLLESWGYRETWKSNNGGQGQTSLFIHA